MTKKTVSVIVATFNSQKTLPMVLASIRGQIYPQENIEILIVDGGSRDKTLAIAKKFHCRIIHNPKIEPTHAKYLGFIRAKGKYIIYIDHDEVILNHDSIKNKVEVLERNPSVKIVVGSGYKDPEHSHIVNRYINEFGDPFSFFIYRLTKNADFFLTTMRKRYRLVKNTERYSVLDLSSSSKIPIIEAGAAGGMIKKKFIEKECGELIQRYQFVPAELSTYFASYPHLGIVKNDPLLHYSSDTFYGYINKIVWRIKNNIFYSAFLETPAYVKRESRHPVTFRVKKYFFLPYAFLFVFPCIDALYLIVTRKNIFYIVHIPLTFITASLIIYYFFLKILGINLTMMSYDGSTKAFKK